MENLTVADMVGWVGAILLLTAYALVSFGRIKSDSVFYQTANIVAGVLLAVSTFYRAAYPAFFLNSVWAIIGLIAIFALMKKNGKSLD